MYCTLICLADIMMSPFFKPKPLSQDYVFQVCLYFGLFLDDMQVLLRLYPAVYIV